MEAKPFYLSKGMWLNVLAVIALVLQNQYGFVLKPETQIAILGVINLILRIVTKSPVSWS